jgi:hypothetical protein
VKTARRRFAILAVPALAALLATSRGRNLAWAAFTWLRGRASIAGRLAEFGPVVRPELERVCAAAGLGYPPARVAIVVWKEERRLEAHATASTGDWRRIFACPVLGASGGPGPKLRAGDGQVPEGLYAVESLNPNSRFHLAIRVGYPNAFDRARAAEDGRTDLGGDIMIHGGTASIGCVAVGDPAIEKLFVLVADAGVGATEIIIAPRDLRAAPALALPAMPPWIDGLYADLTASVERFPQ